MTSRGATISATQSPSEGRRHSLVQGLEYLATTQKPDGAWNGEYGGPLFLLPMFIGIARLIKEPLNGHEREAMVRYLSRYQRDDGSFGLHIEGQGHVFTTTLVYVAMRLLDVHSEDTRCLRARRWVHDHGGPTAQASWGKFFLALLGLYDYRGVQPTPPELWLLPRRFVLHPGRLWCHCRAVYLPMSYLYGKRFVGPDDTLIQSLRRELYSDGFNDVDWRETQNHVADADAYVGRSAPLRAANQLLHKVEENRPEPLRRRALAFVLDQIRQEDENTDFICIGPISKLLHALVWFVEDPGGTADARHRERLRDYLYEDDCGIRMQGYNSSELWDLTFTVQAVEAALGSVKATETTRTMLDRAHVFLERTQVREHVPRRRRYFRDPSKGGWPFSTRAHGWPITDCTAEGIKSALALAPYVRQPIEISRLIEAVDLLLGWQNDDGGWATYERRRAPQWLEVLNPSDCFADIMVDYSYVECTSAAMQALIRMRATHSRELGFWRKARMRRAENRGRAFLLDAQRRDGSWEGSWGVCFSYGTWFATSALRAAGMNARHPVLLRAARYMSQHQNADGGWGESVESCRARHYVPGRSSQPVTTAWAILSLLNAGEKRALSVQRGIEFLLNQQRSDGSWKQDAIPGVFNRTCAINYENYAQLFPLWALSRYELTP